MSPRTPRPLDQGAGVGDPAGQGAGGRTFLASPLTAAASALAGRIADARPLVDQGV